MKRILALFLILTLLVGCCSGCMLTTALLAGAGALLDDEPSKPDETRRPTEAEIPATTAAPIVIDPDDTPRRLVNGGLRDYAPDGYIDMVKLGDMPYERPDTDALLAAFDEATEKAEAGADPDLILEKYYAAYDQYVHFYTMDYLAYIRYTTNTKDSYYKEEYDALELVSPDVEERLEAFKKACAGSASRSALERAYFGYGYFDEYEDYSVYTNPEYLALAKQQEELLSQYRTAMEDPQIEFEGKTRSYWELMEEYGNPVDAESYFRFLEVLKAYYNQYNGPVGEIYLKLIRVRQQIAGVLGYETYADYAYDIIYGRDYTHAQGERFLREIRQELVPISAKMDDVDLGSHFPLDESVLKAGLQSAVSNMGEEFSEAFTFMMAYDLCDLRVADEKFDSSYTIYLYDYEAPFLTINADGTSSDYLTFSHEFGHFLDKYLNYEADEDLETAETFSQAMEFLALCYTEGLLSSRQRQELIEINLSELLDTFVYQAVLASFEDQVYALPEDQLTVENVNNIYYQCCRDYGMNRSYLDFYYRMGWIDVTHFFEAPYYVISYCVSADTALQVYMLESRETGAGLAAYRRLLEREAGAGVQSVMETAGLPNPFREDGLRSVADFYRETFDLN